MIKELLDQTDMDEKLIGTAKKIQKEYKKTLVTALSAGLAFIIALYTKEFLQTLLGLILTKLNISETLGIVSQAVVALVVIIVCVIFIIVLSGMVKE